MARGDRRHSDPPLDNRSPFERDRDRVLYSSAFRRLGGVTQVVAAAEGHAFHNRLTHTLKVAQVAQRLAQALVRAHGARAAELGGIDESVVEAAALAHDLGHPPFGHAAEKVLDALVVGLGVAEGFEGNAQTFRVICRLAVRSEAPGLDLSRATMNAVLKYPWFRQTAGKGARKWGAFHSESEDFSFARALGPVLDTQSIEAAIMDWDDITYAIHDVEDLYRAGLVPLDLLRNSEDERGRFRQYVEAKWDGPPATRLDATFAAFEDVLAVFALTGPYDGTRVQRVALRAATGQQISQYLQATTLSPDGHGEHALQVPEEIRDEVNLLKELTWYYVIDRPSLALQQEGQARVVRDLFELYWDVVHGRRRRALLPRARLDELTALEGGDASAADRARLVADVVASLTEEDALRLHGRMTGADLGSLLDRRTDRP